MRHIYRQERFWSDLADRQVDSEQHAVILQFLGLAKAVFPDERGQEVEARKQIIALQARKEEFERLLSELSQDLVADPALGVSPTEDSLTQRIAEVEERIRILEQTRGAIISSLRDSVSRTPVEAAIDVRLSEERGRLIDEREGVLAEIRRTTKRRDDLTVYRLSVQGELERLERVIAAGQILSGLRVTHCPVCDQEVNPNRASSGRCYLCDQPVASPTAEHPTRVTFEREQVGGEVSELTELIARYDHELQVHHERLRQIDERLHDIESSLRPIRRAAASILPPDLAILDAERGRLGETIRQLERLRKSVEHRRDFAARIDALHADISRLEGQLSQIGEGANFAAAGDALAGGINTYLNAIKKGDASRWRQPAVTASIRKKDFEFRVGGSRWSTELGATLKCYFLMGYHFGLLNLTGRPGFHYPGFCVIDFPPTLADGTILADKENYLIEPFVSLLNGALKGAGQLIVAGRAFEGLAGSHRIELSTAWQASGGA